MSILKDFDLMPGDAILTYSDSWLAKAIFWFSKWHEYNKDKNKISHVAIFLKYENGVPIIAEAENRVVIHSGECYNNKKYIIHVARPILKMSQMKADQLEAYMRGKQGEGYAYIQIAILAVQKIFRLQKVGDWDKGAVICSELYCEAFEDLFAYKICPGKLPADINPLEIYESKNMEKINPRI